MHKAALTFSLAFALAANSQDFPQAQIANAAIKAKLYLPDAEKGYYRATRFDWSGVIASLEYKGHNYFGVWFPKYDPKLHDAITGPVEEFRTGESALGYDEAAAGGTFIRIGVGVLRKPDEPRFQQFKTYEIVDSGKWTVRMRTRPDTVEFVHELADPSSGYAYLYRKTVGLGDDAPQMVIEHSLKNTGKRVIETNVYNHNFFVIDGQPSGPDFSLTFPFELKAKRSLRDLAETRGKQLTYLKEMPVGQSTYTELEGFGDSPKDFDIRVENRKVGAGVRVTGDRPLSKMVFWSIRTTLCPEAYIEMKIEPGREFTWRLKYDFYTVDRTLALCGDLPCSQILAHPRGHPLALLRDDRVAGLERKQ